MTEPLLWEDRVREIETRIPIAPPDPIVFTGSSTFALWRTLARDFADLPVFNAGFGGSTMAQVAARAPRIVVPLQSRLIVLFAGENDLALGGTCDDVMRDFEAFCEVTAPTPILALSVKPSPGRMEFRAAMEELNQRLKTACDYDYRLTYLDVWTPMLGVGGEPLTGFWMRDGIHINRAGYDLWIRLLRPLLI